MSRTAPHAIGLGNRDRGCFDLVLEANGVMRHVQLKSSHRTAKTSRVTINVALARKPSGCVVWIRFDPVSMELGPFLWFGGAPGAPLPPLGDRVGKHTKGDRNGVKAERPNIRILNRGEFEVLPSMDAVVLKLFGLEPEGSAVMRNSELSTAGIAQDGSPTTRL